MTSQSENDLLTNVGAGTQMGASMRQYWLPACLSAELKVDGNPLRLMVLERFQVIDRTQEYHVQATDWGTMSTAHRPARPGATYHPFGHFAMPIWTLIPHGPLQNNIVAHAWAPMDDAHTTERPRRWPTRPTGSAVGRRQTISTYYPIDREAQRTVDRKITPTRRRFPKAARALRDHGTMPSLADNPEVSGIARSGDLIAPASQRWRETYELTPTQALRPGLAAVAR